MQMLDIDTIHAPTAGMPYGKVYSSSAQFHWSSAAWSRQHALAVKGGHCDWNNTLSLARRL